MSKMGEKKNRQVCGAPVLTRPVQGLEPGIPISAGEEHLIDSAAWSRRVRGEIPGNKISKCQNIES